ncbi:hypothetical protein [Capybara microvirus Cap3_SP_389]|nr:hypothetical protein [Capybara microvirus Cap3_SP_389]
MEIRIPIDGSKEKMHLFLIILESAIENFENPLNQTQLLKEGFNPYYNAYEKAIEWRDLCKFQRERFDEEVLKYG